jgi:hypothetical protein
MGEVESRNRKIADNVLAFLDKAATNHGRMMMAERFKHQSAYEKARDRFLVRAGYRVLHFTGAEVVADPYKVAHEALSLIGVFSDQNYDAANPLHLD